MICVMLYRGGGQCAHTCGCKSPMVPIRKQLAYHTQDKMAGVKRRIMGEVILTLARMRAVIPHDKDNRELIFPIS